MKFERSKQRLGEAARHLAGGVSSNFRLGMSPHPLVIERADGPFVYDLDGNRLIDYYLGMGPMILGHRPDVVVRAVEQQLRRGLLYAGQSEVEFEAAELVCRMVPCAERVRFGSSGSEVMSAAFRVARACTGRQIVIKFEGHYHGWLDNQLWSVMPGPDQFGSADQPRAVPGSEGQDLAAGQHVEALRWNRLDAVVRRIERGDVAAVVMEPAMCNTGVIPPEPGYLEGVRDACRTTGTVLIFDEVITGFRVGPGGVQQLTGVTPDLAVLAKAIANGFPVACLAGKAELMELLATRRVMHGGTFNSQPVGMAATVATLKTLADPATYRALERQGRRLMDGLGQVLREAGIEHRIQGYPAVFHVALGTSAPMTDYRECLAADRSRYVRFTTGLLERGIRALERGVWFMSTAHDDAVIDSTLAAARDAAVSV